MQRARPPKPVAMFGAVFGVAFLIFGVVMMSQWDHPSWAFLALWVTAGIGVISYNLWAAFGKEGRLYDIEDRS